MSAMTFLDFFFLGTSSFLLTSKGSHVRRRLLSILRSINKHPVRSGKMSPYLQGSQDSLQNPGTACTPFTQGPAKCCFFNASCSYAFQFLLLNLKQLLCNHIFLNICQLGVNVLFLKNVHAVALLRLCLNLPSQEQPLKWFRQHSMNLGTL